MTHAIRLHDATGILVEVPGLGITISEGTAVPPDGSAGYANGALFLLINAGATTEPLYRNMGTNSSCLFQKVSSPNDSLNANGGFVVPTGKTGAFTDADSATVGGIILPQKLVLTTLIMPHASLATRNLFTAVEAYKVTAIRMTPSLAQGGTLTGTICKTTGTNAPLKTATPMQTADELDFNATANTVQTGTLTSTAADLALAAGDRIGLALSAALTTGVASVTIEMQRV